MPEGSGIRSVEELMSVPSEATLFDSGYHSYGTYLVSMNLSRIVVPFNGANIPSSGIVLYQDYGTEDRREISKIQLRLLLRLGM